MSFAAAGRYHQSTLTKQLRELERDGFLHREIFQEIPPHVEYSLTDMGKSFVPILNEMLLWEPTASLSARLYKSLWRLSFTIKIGTALPCIIVTIKLK